MLDTAFEYSSGTAPVWAIHGSASSPGIWRPLAAALASGNPVRTVALPGNHGAPVAPAVGLASRAAPLIAQIEAGGRPVHLVGHSMGGAVALKIASLRPDLVESVALYEPMLPSLLDGEKTDAERAALSEVEAVSVRLSAAVACGVPGDGMAQFTDFWGGEGCWSAIGPERRACMAGQAVNVMADFADAFLDAMGMADLAAIDVPVAVVRGSRSPAIAGVIALRLLAGLPDAVQVVLSDADHLAPMRVPGRVAAVVRAHIRAAELVGLFGHDSALASAVS